MSRIIFLNGCSSAGKTSLVKAIQHLSDEPWLTFGIDTFFKVLSPNYLPGGKKLRKEFSLFQARIQKDFQKIAVSSPKMMKQLTDNGHNLIIDEVIWDKKDLENYASALKNFQVFYVKVDCELPLMEEREILRGDRSLGLARVQFAKMKNLSWNYNLEVNTSHKSPFTNAKKVLELIKESKISKQVSNKLPNFVRVVIQDEKGGLLVVLGKKWDCWVFPGGKIELNETPLEAAKREVFEETNLIIEDLEIVGEKVFSGKSQNCMGYLVRANKYSGEIRNKEPRENADIQFKIIDYEFAINRLFYAIEFWID